LRYRDDAGFFPGATKLYPYVTALKTRYLNQGQSQVSSDGGTREMNMHADGWFHVTFVVGLDNVPSLHQEFLAGLTIAFTSQFPYSGEAPWDSNSHKNHGVWLR
jgi:hypothetical protein